MDPELKALEQKIIDFRDQRDWAQFHSPKNLSQALGIEVAELQEIFLWETSEASRAPRAADRIRAESEMADIFIYLTYLCRELDVDIFQAVEKKLIENESSPRQAAGNLHRKDRNRFPVRSLTPPQATVNALAIAVQPDRSPRCSDALPCPGQHELAQTHR